MVDKLNPTSQFHPYQPQDAIPQTGSSKSVLTNILERVGLDRSRIDAMTNVDVRGGLDKARVVARNNGGLVLGGLAALVIGAGLMRRRSKK
ncbi:MAG: hypothetical protein WA208_13530 [Thermoanaerobaculia bacterium]